MWFLITLALGGDPTCLEKLQSHRAEAERRVQVVVNAANALEGLCEKAPENCEAAAKEVLAKKAEVEAWGRTPPKCEAAPLVLSEEDKKQIALLSRIQCDKPSYDLITDCEVGKCSENMELGFRNNIVFNLELFEDLAHMADFSSVGEATPEQALDEKSTEALVGALDMKEETFLQWTQDRVQATADLVSGFMAGIAQAATTTFGCEEWEGEPFASKCVRSTQSFGCATCAQKRDILCGVAGFMGGEIPSGFIMGGVMGVTMALGMRAKDALPGSLKKKRFLKRRQKFQEAKTWIKRGWELRPHPLRRLPSPVRSSVRVALAPARRYLNVTDWATMVGLKAGLISTELLAQAGGKALQQIKRHSRPLSRCKGGLNAVLQQLQTARAALASNN